MDLGLFFLLYTVSFVLFVCADLLWLGVIAKDFYRTCLGSLMGEVVFIAVFMFYPLFVFGLTYFVTYPAALGGSVLRAALSGALFGLVAYATYDLTNWATLKSWSVKVVVVDMAWGTILGGATAAAAVVLSSIFI